MNFTHNKLEKQLCEAVAYIQESFPALPSVAIILGSGLGPFADKLENPTMIETVQIPHYPVSTVSGHKGRWVLGELNGKSILAVQGRVHFYEGYAMQEVVYPIHLLAELGVKTLIVTNAAGGVNLSYRPGDLMLITDHINLMGDNPLIGPNNDRLGPRFPDMSEPYDIELQKIAEQAGLDLKIRLQQGVSAALKGPCYETAAEIRMLRTIGADAVTMSTIPEVITANHRGMKVMGISCISNMGTGISGEKLDHDEVTKTAEKIQHNFIRLMDETITRFPD